MGLTAIPGWGWDWDEENPEGHQSWVEAGIGMHFLLSLLNPGLLSEAGKGPQVTGTRWRCPSAEIPGGNILAEPFGNGVFPKTPNFLPQFSLVPKMKRSDNPFITLFLKFSPLFPKKEDKIKGKGIWKGEKEFS